MTASVVQSSNAYIQQCLTPGNSLTLKLNTGASVNGTVLHFNKTTGFVFLSKAGYVNTNANSGGGSSGGGGNYFIVQQRKVECVSDVKKCEEFKEHYPEIETHKIAERSARNEMKRAERINCKASPLGQEIFNYLSKLFPELQWGAANTIQINKSFAIKAPYTANDIFQADTPSQPSPSNSASTASVNQDQSIASSTANTTSKTIAGSSDTTTSSQQQTSLNSNEKDNAAPANSQSEAYIRKLVNRFYELKQDRE